MSVQNGLYITCYLTFPSYNPTAHLDTPQFDVAHEDFENKMYALYPRQF